MRLLSSCTSRISSLMRSIACATKLPGIFYFLLFIVLEMLCGAVLCMKAVVASLLRWYLGSLVKKARFVCLVETLPTGTASCVPVPAMRWLRLGLGIIIWALLLEALRSWNRCTMRRKPSMLSSRVFGRFWPAITGTKGLIKRSCVSVKTISSYVMPVFEFACSSYLIPVYFVSAFIFSLSRCL